MNLSPLTQILRVRTQTVSCALANLFVLALEINLIMD